MEKIKQLQDEALGLIRQAKDLAELDSVRIRFLGKKGELTEVLKSLGSLSPEERPKVGALVNEAKVVVEVALNDQKVSLQAREQQQKIASEKIDITLPGKGIKQGKLHPLTQTMERAKDIFLDLGV